MWLCVWLSVRIGQNQTICLGFEKNQALGFSRQKDPTKSAKMVAYFLVPSPAACLSRWMVALITTQSHPCPYLTTKRLRIFFGCSEREKTASFFGVIDSFLGRLNLNPLKPQKREEKCHTHRGTIINRRWASKQVSSLTLGQWAKKNKKKATRKKFSGNVAKFVVVFGLNKLTIRSPNRPADLYGWMCVRTKLWVRPPRRLLHAFSFALRRRRHNFSF